MSYLEECKCYPLHSCFFLCLSTFTWMRPELSLYPPILPAQLILSSIMPLFSSLLFQNKSPAAWWSHSIFITFLRWYDWYFKELCSYHLKTAHQLSVSSCVTAGKQNQKTEHVLQRYTKHCLSHLLVIRFPLYLGLLRFLSLFIHQLKFLMQKTICNHVHHRVVPENICSLCQTERLLN